MVSSATFGDPCPGTPKYLQLLYHCQERQQEQDSSMAPPWLLPMDQLLPSSTPATSTLETSSVGVRSRFLDFMERVMEEGRSRESMVEKRSRVNTLIQEEESREAVPYLGEEELEQQRTILVSVTVSLVSSVLLLCLAALATTCSRRSPPVYYQGQEDLQIPPSPSYPPFQRCRPRSLPAGIVITHQDKSHKQPHAVIHNGHNFGPNLQEYDYIAFPSNVTHI